MIQFAHISDIHLSPLPTPSWRELMGKRITGYLNWKKNRKNAMGSGALDAVMHDLWARKPQHLLISGDLVNLSLDKEFVAARHWLEHQGQPKQDGNSDNISLTFGNHDAYVIGALQKACDYFAPWIAPDAPKPWQEPFPFMRKRNEVAFISASSALATPPFCAAGYFGEKQAQHLATLLEQAKDEGLFRVVMIHHPPLYHATPWMKKLWGIKRFQRVIAQSGAELILHGHTHLPTLSRLCLNHQTIPVVGVSSASQGFGGHKPAAGYNWFEVDKKNGQWQCALTRFSIVDAQNEIKPILRDIL